uniref:Link domain-containing protein n=1 Tax=viral metagenome TaxID=1070528 RepID=A0A6C0B2R1_9ZZZZ
MSSLPYPVILSVSGVLLVMLAIIVGLVSGSWTASLVVVALAGVVIYILLTFGSPSVQKTDNGMNIDINPIPNPSDTTQTQGTGIKEVFHISDNTYTYEEAPAVCAAYGAELASYDQITEAQVQGAEWCSYGWSAAGMALYPTQQATWEALQHEPAEKKRTACGHPGVNGGYFDPRLKFGVNCYGRKPPNMGTKLPRPLPGTDEAGFERMVNKFKSMLRQMKLSPFNRDIWSKGTFWSEGSPAPAMPPSPPPKIIPGEITHHHRRREPGKPPTTYDGYTEYVCKTFGICNYANDEDAAHQQAENATDAEARDRAAGNTGPMSHQK